MRDAGTPLGLPTTSARTSWNNTGDYVLLSDPAGNPVHCLYWGDFAEPVPGATLSEKVPTTSVPAWPIFVPEVPYRFPADSFAHFTSRQ